MFNQEESKRIIETYNKRSRDLPPDYYSFFKSHNLYFYQTLMRDLLDVCKKNNIFSFKNIRILDVGCGEGNLIHNLILYGAEPKKCYGVDLLPERIKRAESINPTSNFRCADAQKLPYKNYRFDLIIESTLFSSVLNPIVKKQIAKETLRVLKNNGNIIWYDFFINNPKNSCVKAISKKEIFKLFPKCEIKLRRVTLASPIMRIFVKNSFILPAILEKLKIFDTHYIGIIRKKNK